MINPTSTRPAAPPTTPPAIVPAGAVVSSLPLPPAEVLVLEMPLEVAVAPSPATPARPTPLGSSEELWVDDGEAVEKTVDRTVDPSVEITVTEPLGEDVAPLEDGEIVATWPSAKDVVNGSSDRVIVVTSPLDWVAKYKALRSIEELESVVCESLEEVELAVRTETQTALLLVKVEARNTSVIRLVVETGIAESYRSVSN